MYWCSVNKRAVTFSGKGEVHAGIATSKYDISGCGGAFCFVPGPLKSPLRALSTDVTVLNLGLIPVVLMAFEYGESSWRILLCGALHRKTRSCGRYHWNDQTNYCLQ